MTKGVYNMSYNNEEMVYDENVDYESLEQRTYSDQPGIVYYICPRCGGEYMATFIVSEGGRTMCVDCLDNII